MGVFAYLSARRRRTKVRLLGWRWRRNPLRRRSDLVEAWLGLVTALLLCTVPFLGWWSGRSVDRALQHVVRVEHRERTLVAAAVAPARTAKDAAKSLPGSAGSAAEDAQRGDLLVWTGPDHRKHSATVSSDLEVWRDGTLRLWTDRQGRIAPPPLDSATAVTHSVLAGIAAASAAGGMLLIVRQVLLWRLMLRRMDSWERAWDRAGQDWGRAGAGG
ncbi:Rv1733c family protein [Actinacidiphila rubida]|uniref:Rv1733c family protein n=1 Tax=Actinacidiphila rubida TaxID=310780 RepID=UPI0009A05624|nr:hypothetical protein [Actinacidiphila rubida]